MRSDHGHHHPHLRRLGDGHLDALGAPGKVALLDRCAAAGLPVPAGVVARGAALTGLPVEALASQLVEVAPGRVVVVRSAFAGEDTATSSNAGRYASVLHVDATDAAALTSAVGTVLASADELAEERTVLVQRQVDARHAGVAFTEPDHEDDLVDVVAGLADGLVAGREAGERHRLPRLARGEHPTDDDWRGRLAVLLRDVRRELGAAPGTPGWDLEWADDGATCWLVQVRPVTAPPLRDAALTLANHREILPDPPSVFMTALVVGAADDLFGYWRGFAPDLPAGRPFIEELAGRPLINLSLLTDTMRRLGLPTSFVTDSMGGSATEALPRTGLRPRRLLAHAPALLGLGLDQLRSPGSAPDLAAELQARAAAVDRADAAADEVVAAAHDVYVGLVTGMFALSTAISGPLAVLQRLGVSAEHHARHRSAGTRVWDDLAPLRALVAAEPARQRAVETGEVPGDAAFVAQWTAYLAEHGHRGVHESDLSMPRYHEDPAPLLALLTSDGRGGPTTASPRTVAGTLTTPLWWQAGRAIRAREDLRSGAMRAFDVLRRRLLAIAADAVEAGRLARPEDVWDCTTDEVVALATGGGPTPAALARRREERAALARLRLPDVVRRSDDPADWDPAGAPPAGRRLRGLPLTRGRVEGTVWRLDRPDHTAVPPADSPILVVPAVDAGWIATFARADAVVVETGGELSHGSIVLRERGVPAVTNVAGATALEDGARVVVDAAAGTITRLD